MENIENNFRPLKNLATETETAEQSLELHSLYFYEMGFADPRLSAINRVGRKSRSKNNCYTNLSLHQTACTDE